LRLRARTLFKLDRRGRMLACNDEEGGSAPRFFLSRTSAGNVWLCRADLERDLVDAVAAFCQREPTPRLDSPLPTHHTEYLRLLAAYAPIASVGGGPAYCFDLGRAPAAAAPGVAIHRHNAHLLHGGMQAWQDCVPDRVPMLAAIVAGHAVAVCASVRIGRAAHEAGIETLPAYRRQGYATQVATAWAAAVATLGAVPLYSTAWQNQASRAVAARLGLVQYAVDYHIS
jgi:GNAT superfamily N-acetyltransferase